MALEAVLFDLGGTLLHYHDRYADDHRQPFRRVTLAGLEAVLRRLAEDGVPLPPAEKLREALDRRIGADYRADWEARRGGSIERSVRAGLAEMGLDLTEAQWADLRPALYSAVDTIVFPRAGVYETLHTLRAAGYRLGLISNTHWAADLHDRHLREHGLLDLLPLRIYSCDTPFMKPHPGIFRLALDALGLPPETAVYVGDRPDVDVEAAQQVGMRGILIRSPYRPEAGPGEAGGVAPDAVVDELSDLIPVLHGLEKAGI